MVSKRVSLVSNAQFYRTRFSQLLIGAAFGLCLAVGQRAEAYRIAGCQFDRKSRYEEHIGYCGAFDPIEAIAPWFAVLRPNRV
jgi:hypothetical protein